MEQTPNIWAAVEQRGPSSHNACYLEDRFSLSENRRQVQLKKFIWRMSLKLGTQVTICVEGSRKGAVNFYYQEANRDIREALGADTISQAVAMAIRRGTIN